VKEQEAALAAKEAAQKKLEAKVKPLGFGVYDLRLRI